jgi:NADH-quinone oxidoreductase subunit J
VTITNIAFFAFIALTMGGAITVLLTRNVLYAAYSLLLALLGVAGLFVFAGADFLAVSQIVIYVGGVLVLVLFGVMLTNKPLRDYPAPTTAGNVPVSERPNSILTEIRNPWLAIALAVGLFWGLSRVLANAQFMLLDRPPMQADTTVDTLGRQLMTEFLLPFAVGRARRSRVFSQEAIICLHNTHFTCFSLPPPCSALGWRLC